MNDKISPPQDFEGIAEALRSQKEKRQKYGTYALISFLIAFLPFFLIDIIPSTLIITPLSFIVFLYFARKSSRYALKGKDSIFLDCWEAYKSLENFSKRGSDISKDDAIQKLLKVRSKIDYRTSKIKEYMGKWEDFLEESVKKYDRLTDLIKMRLLPTVQSLNRSDDRITKVIQKLFELVYTIENPQIERIDACIKSLEELDKGEFKRLTIRDQLSNLGAAHPKLREIVKHVCLLFLSFGISSILALGALYLNLDINTAYYIFAGGGISIYGIWFTYIFVKRG